MQIFSVLVGLNLAVEADETRNIPIDHKFHHNSAVPYYPYLCPGSSLTLINSQFAYDEMSG